MSEHETDGDAAVDRELSGTGEALRRDTTPVDGREVIVASLRRKATRARRANVAVLAAAALVVVAMLPMALPVGTSRATMVSNTGPLSIRNC